MPILPSEVGGSGPRDEDDYAGSADRTRLRQLCEVLLTSRAKMLGLSQSFAHRLSSLPSDLKSSLVNALGEIIAHLDSFEIKLGDTRLTGKVRLGADGGMEAHFPRGEMQVSGHDHPNVLGRTFGGPGFGSQVSARRDPDLELRAETRNPKPFSAHPALPAPGGAARRRRRMSTEDAPPVREALVERPRSSGGGERDRCAVRDDGDFRYCRECLEKPCRWFPRGAGHPEEAEDDGTYGHLYRLAQERRRKGLNGSPLSRLEHGLLCWVTLAVFSDDPERPEAPYEAREEALRQLERMGYVRRVGRKWGPTPSGFEASGLVGTRGLELDP